MNEYPLWKNLLVIFVVLFGALFATSNLYGEDPAVVIGLGNEAPIDEATMTRTGNSLEQQGIPYTSMFLDSDRMVVLFADEGEQLRAADHLRTQLGSDYVVALTLAPQTPAWLRAMGLKPMSLGLDLRGGVHFLFEVDLEGAITQTLQRFETDFRSLLRNENIPYVTVRQDGNEVRIVLRRAEDLDRAQRLVSNADNQLVVGDDYQDGKRVITVRMSEQQIRDRQDFAIEQNTVTMRNRVNELGVAEPVVQRQGLDRIVVQLPGIQDPTLAERVLGATATLEFRLVDTEQNAYEAARRNRAPLGTKLYTQRDGAPILLKRDVIVSGDQLTDATSGFDQDGLPAVFVKLDAKGARKMLSTTQKNLNKPMAVIFIEKVREARKINGETVYEVVSKEEVINVATIRGVFSASFQITGLDTVEARTLALLLRAGALAAPIFKVEERTVGPSLGRANVEQGFQAVVIGFFGVVMFMALYYRVFGMVANLALIMNLVLIVALLSLLQASLTLPGIAGIVLTVGMAVDANVLIFERIREEIRNGNTPQASIHAGYQKAFSSIADANITTLIAAVVLFTFGTGPIKGFAITLSLGIVTSMFTAIVGTRAVINLIYGGRRLTQLRI
ncbi:MAG: protein translocase subunit SecD [Gammaproteobacteria bacterium]